MAADNRTLAKFELVGIPPAPRGIPRIEVVFDIDVNGIVSVSAKDLATHQEQRIRVHSSSGLTEQEIESMIRAAEQYREADKKKSLKAQLRNQADALMYDSEKALIAHGSRLKEDDRIRIRDAIESIRAFLSEGDEDGVRSAMKVLSEAKIALDEVVFSTEETEVASEEDAQQFGDEEENGSSPEEVLDCKDSHAVATCISDVAVLHVMVTPLHIT